MDEMAHAQDESPVVFGAGARPKPPGSPGPLPRLSVACGRRPGAVWQAQWVVFWLACAVIIVLHAVLFSYTGAFWRDEASSIYVARSPTIGVLWNSLALDSFPVLFGWLLKLWIDSGPGGTETGLRLFGVLISAGVLPAVFFASRRLRGAQDAGAPLLAVALSVFNVSVFYYGSSIRAYGLASLLIVLCLASFWRLIQEPGTRTGAAALLLALLSAHSNYHNTYLVFGIGVAGAVTCAVCGFWKRSLLVLGLCSAAALSMLVYLPVIRAFQAVTGFGSAEISLSSGILAGQAIAAVSGGSRGLLAAWGLLLLSAAAVLSLRLVSRLRSAPGGKEPSLDLYCLVALLAGTGAAAAFFKYNANLPRPWYFVPFIVFAAVILEAGLRQRKNSFWTALARLAAAGCVLMLSLPPLWGMARLRRTNMDLVARAAAEKAGPGDLIVVYPHWLAWGFQHYYRGRTDWITLPAFPRQELFSVADGGPFRKLMRTRGALEPTTKRITGALAAGKVVWFVGRLRAPVPGSLPPVIGPAMDPRSGSGVDDYSGIWGLQTAYLLQQHVLRAEPVAMPEPLYQPVNTYENLPLLRVEGWR